MAGIEPDRSEEALNRANRGFKRFSKLLVKQAGKPTMNALASTGPILTSENNGWFEIVLDRKVEERGVLFEHGRWVG